VDAARPITFDEIAHVRKLLAKPVPEPTDCEPDCEHIECGFVVACEKHTAERARLAETFIGPLLDALEHSMNQEAQTGLTLDGFVGDLEKAHNAQVPTEIRCPQCSLLHVDQDEWATTRLHRKHLCHGCKHIWAPYLVTTVGVDYHVTCRESIDNLTKRRDELLALVANLSQTVPLESEVAEALNQRGALLAEVGSLKARVVELQSMLPPQPGEQR
jgi:hypothetical protein